MFKIYVMIALCNYLLHIILFSYRHYVIILLVTNKGTSTFRSLNSTLFLQGSVMW
jgi:hypothetical protein